MTDNKRTIAFLSYARFDDNALNGYISEFRQHVSETVEQYIGEKFEIFQDRYDIGWGDDWRNKIIGSLDDAFFLIPIIMPKFFRSEACREEVERFRERERRLGRNDLILPVYIIDCLILHDEKRTESNSVARLIYSRQWED